MANKELKIPIHYRKYAAMREALERGGKNFDEQLQAKAEEWYQELIPESKRKEIQKQIDADDLGELLKEKQFAVVRIRDEFEEYAFISQRGENFFSIAKNYVEASKSEDLKQYTLDTIGQRCFGAENTLYEDWKAYDLYTLTKAVENAEDAVGLTEQEREQIFRSNLEGEDLDQVALGLTPP